MAAPGALCWPDLLGEQCHLWVSYSERDNDSYLGYESPTGTFQYINVEVYCINIVQTRSNLVWIRRFLVSSSSILFTVYSLRHKLYALKTSLKKLPFTPRSPSVFGGERPRGPGMMDLPLGIKAHGFTHSAQPIPPVIGSEVGTWPIWGQ